MKHRQVVITGMGLITPLGIGPGPLWTGLVEGTTAVGRVTRFDPSQFRSQLAAEVTDADIAVSLPDRFARRLDRFAQLGVAAARHAYEDGCLTRCHVPRDRIGVSVGSALGGVSHAEEQHERFLADGLRAVSPFLALAVYGGASGANIAIDLDLRGPNSAHAASCASGAVAIGEAMRAIRRGDADVMLAGGVEAPLAPLTFGAFALIKAMSTRNSAPHDAVRPFDRERDGFVMGEAAAMLVLEERVHAERRGARVYATVEGFGQTNDAYHMTAPRPDGSEAARAITLALRDASAAAESVEYVNAHATGTQLGDSAEALAIRTALGPAAASIPVSGTKGTYGHALGASGAIEIAITALALQTGFLPGTSNLTVPDDGCALSLIPPAGMTRHISRALTTSFGFGGINAALVLGLP